MSFSLAVLTPTQPQVRLVCHILHRVEGVTSTCLFVAPGAADETLLPCEFCEELYPEELLLDHQVCVT